MKKITRIISAVLIVACLLSISAFAAPGTSLNKFEKIANMGTTTFNDLVSNHWAFSGIKACYDRGIIIGYPDGSFHPEETITWSHAITIAARVHATYYGKTLNSTPRSGDYWYSPYYRYCSNNSLLPSSLPKLSSLDSRDISRYDLAYIFSRLLKSEDTPSISNRKIPDESIIPSKYLKSVQTMYNSGIMNGMDGNEFRGSSYATRAQIAAVVARLIIPSLRDGYDSKANSAMQNYQANLENDSVCVQLGSRYYCLYKTYTEDFNEEYSLYLTDGKSLCKKLYTAADGEYLSNISAYGSKVYFCKSTAGTASGSLLCYNPATEETSVVYSGSIVESYCFYNSGLYALLFTDYANNVSGYKYSFGKISITNHTFSAIKSGYTYYEVMHFQPYGWNGKIYFKLSSKNGPTNLYAYSISGKSISKVLNVDINTSFFDGHVMYFLAFDSAGGYDRNLYAVSVQCPGSIHCIGAFPASTDSRYRSIYKFDDTVYCLSSFNRNIYSMDSAGKTRVALTCGGVFNALCFTKDKAVLIPNTLATSNANELKIYNSGTLSSRSLYGDWIGESCYYEGARFTTEEGQAKYVCDQSVSTASKLPITVTEAFHRGDDFIIRAKYVNEADGDIKLRAYTIRVSVNGQTVAQDANRMPGFELKRYGIQTFTFVISQDDIMLPFDVAKDNIQIMIDPDYDLVVVDESTVK